MAGLKSEGALPKGGALRRMSGRVLVCLYLELRPRRPSKLSREHARPQPQPPARPPAAGTGSRRGADDPAPVLVGVTGHRTQRPRGQVGPPGGPHHPAPCRTRRHTADMGPPNGPIQRPNPIRYAQCECCKTITARSLRNTKIGPCGTRALPRLGNMALKVVKMGILARANGAIDGPYCSPAWPTVRVEGNQCMYLSRCGSLAAVGRFFNSSA